MNWKEIKKKYPKSIVLLKKWLYLKPGDEGDLGLNMISELLHTERRLYDFFDDQGICIYPLRGSHIRYSLGCGYEIQPYRIIPYERRRQHGFKTRKKAEKAAFLKAFELLEKCS